MWARGWLLALFALLGTAAPAPAPARTPQVKHVFTIVLENEGASTTFGDRSPAPYLAKTLPAMGQLLPNYYGIGHASLDNYIAMLSGQAPNAQTQADCLLYTDFLGSFARRDGQVAGAGCVYPSHVKTIADQLTAAGMTWKGYMEDMGADPRRERSTCGHPALDRPDRTQSATASDQYAARHDPFVYFHSIVDSPACDANVVNLSRLAADLATASATPSYAFITPDLCHDGHDAECADGGPGGLAAADGFLREWVPRILASPAYRDGGLLVVTFDEAGSDSSACCDEPAGPNTPAPGGPAGGPGGGRTGAVVLSPFVTPGSVSTQPYNHYSLLRTHEDLFGLAHLGFASQDGLQAFGSDVFTRTPAAAPRSGTAAPRSGGRRAALRRAGLRPRGGAPPAPAPGSTSRRRRR